MFLVYEKNYLGYEGVDCVEERDMKLFNNKENAISYMKQERDAYIEESKESGFTFIKNKSNNECFVFADEDELEENGCDRAGEFHICLVELQVED